MLVLKKVSWKMVNEDDGYIEMEHSNVHDIAMPTALMDVGHHFDDVPRSSHRTRRKGSEEDLPSLSSN